MDKNEIISAFAFNTGKKIERLIQEHTNNLENENRMLEAKILMWYSKTKDKDFAEFFDISISRNGN
jgi:hypothetical protein